MRGWLGKSENQAAVTKETGVTDPAAQASSSAATLTQSISTGSTTPQSLPGTDSSLSSKPLPLYLVATVPGRNKNEGTARIGTSRENPQTYAAGALLANGARLAEIHEDHVVLTQGGRSVKLLRGQDPLARPARGADALLTVGAQEAPPLATTKMARGLTDYLRPNPVYDGEIMRGCELYPGAKSGIFARLGLQAGDVLTSINDAPMADPAQALQLLDQLMDGVALTATVERKGVVRRITLDGAVIVADQESARETAPQPVAAFPSG